jgi:hypothetical protein
MIGCHVSVTAPSFQEWGGGTYAVRCSERAEGDTISLGRAVAVAGERLVRPVEGMHLAISRRWFEAVGPVAAPIGCTMR